MRTYKYADSTSPGDAAKVHCLVLAEIQAVTFMTKTTATTWTNVVLKRKDAILFNFSKVCYKKTNLGFKIVQSLSMMCIMFTNYIKRVAECTSSVVYSRVPICTRIWSINELVQTEFVQMETHTLWE